MGNQMVLLIRIAVSLQGKPTYDSEGDQRHEERNIRFVFDAQGSVLPSRHARNSTIDQGLPPD